MEKLLACGAIALSAAVVVEQSGVSATFIGASLIGITTWLPERVASIAALIEQGSLLVVLGYGLGLWLVFQ